MSRRVQTSNQLRAVAITRVLNGESAASVARDMKVDRSTVCRWLPKADAIVDANPKKSFVGTRGRPPLLPRATEKRLLDWLRQMRTVRYLCVSVRCLSVILAKIDPHYVSTRSRTAILMALYRFMRRQKLTIRRVTHKGMSKRSDTESVADHFGQVVRFLMESDTVIPTHPSVFKPNFLWNMDQTAIYIDMSARTTIDFIGVRNVDVVQSMSPNAFRASVFLCASATGKKLRPFIFAGAPDGPVKRELVQVNKEDSRVVCTTQKNAYCDEVVMHEWIEDIWSQSVASSTILLLDSLKVHKMDSVRKLLEDVQTFVQFVPPGATGLCQPMDVSVMKVFKSTCEQLYMDARIEDSSAESPVKRRRRIVNIVAEAWDSVSTDTIRRGFLKAQLLPIGSRERDGSFEIKQPSEDGEVEGANPVDRGDELHGASVSSNNRDDDDGGALVNCCQRSQDSNDEEIADDEEATHQFVATFYNDMTFAVV